MSLSEQLTRDLAFKNNMDPRGNKWGIVPIKGSALFEARVVEGNKQSAIPEEVEGRWTSAPRTQVAIEKYLKRAWDESDLAAVKAQRKQGIKEEEAA